MCSGKGHGGRGMWWGAVRLSIAWSPCEHLSSLRAKTGTAAKMGGVSGQDQWCGPCKRSPHMLSLSTSGMALHGVTDKQEVCATVNKGVDGWATGLKTTGAACSVAWPSVVDERAGDV